MNPKRTDKQPNPNYIPPASAGYETPEFSGVPMPPIKTAQPVAASEYITISVAEYHFLTKAATLLEAVMECEGYHRDGTVRAARKILQDMKRQAEAGAEE